MCKTKKELTSAVARFRQLKAQEAALKKSLEDTKKEILEYLEYVDAEPNEKITGKNYTVSYYIGTSTSWDQDALKIALGESDLTCYKKQSFHKRLSVS